MASECRSGTAKLQLASSLTARSTCTSAAAKSSTGSGGPEKTMHMKASPIWGKEMNERKRGKEVNFNWRRCIHTAAALV